MGLFINEWGAGSAEGLTKVRHPVLAGRSIAEKSRERGGCRSGEAGSLWDPRAMSSSEQPEAGMFSWPPSQLVLRARAGLAVGADSFPLQEGSRGAQGGGAACILLQ